MDVAGKTFNFVSALTGVVVLLYVVAGIVAFIMKITTWQEFSGAVGPLAGTLLGYFLKGEKA